VSGHRQHPANLEHLKSHGGDHGAPLHDLGTSAESVRSLLSLLLHGSHTGNVVEGERVDSKRGAVHVDLVAFVDDLHTTAHFGIGSSFVAFRTIDDS
jgi:hypothetical protein